MAEIKRLDTQALCWRFDTEKLPFKTTAELLDLTEVVGQARATEAIRFGIGIRRDGYNLFVHGSSGTGRHDIVRRFLEERAAKEAVPPDWCYVHNFEQPHKPRALKLPAGRGAKLRDDMERLVEDLKSAIPAVFESEEYRARRQEIEESLKEKHEKAFDGLRQEAESRSIALMRTPGGMAFAPTRKGEVVSPADFEKLPQDEQEKIEAVIATLQEQLERLVHQVPQWRRESQERIRELDRQVTRSAVGHLIDELKKAYADLSEVVRYFDTVQEAVVENADDFKRPEGGSEVSFLGLSLSRPHDGSSLHRYQVNLLIDNGKTQGAPVVYEDNPTHPDIVGRVEHLSQLGALVTDFTLIKPGALHRANGGYLVLDARKVLMQPYAWEVLKRCLSSNEVRIESLGQMLSLVSTVSLDPEAIPLDVKVVLVGERMLYYLLQYYDPDFQDLFKVAADFEDTMPRADADHVQRAIDARIRRADRLRERMLEEIKRGTILIDTQGSSVGQVNGLSVVGLGDFAFGHPSRITARVRLGKGEVLDIQREIEMGGPIHSKGVLILAGFLGARYCAERPLALSASLVFEQTYGEVEGDSASSAELYALLSALAEVPVKQSLAVTGSVNQHGEIQPIGGVNEKIEGFFDVCQTRGLTGEQGVLIPASNVKHLMLRDDVVEACKQGKFHVYPVTTADEGIALLTGFPAGARDAQGRFPEGSLNRHVEQRLTQMAELARSFAGGEEEKE